MMPPVGHSIPAPADFQPAWVLSFTEEDLEYGKWRFRDLSRYYVRRRETVSSVESRPSAFLPAGDRVAFIGTYTEVLEFFDSHHQGQRGFDIGTTEFFYVETPPDAEQWAGHLANVNQAMWEIINNQINPFSREKFHRACGDIGFNKWRYPHGCV